MTSEISLEVKDLDHIEKNKTIAVLQNFLDEHTDYPVHTLKKTFITGTPGSSLDQLHEPGRHMFERFIQDPEFQLLCSLLRVPDDSRMSIDSQTKLYILQDGDWHDIAYSIQFYPALASQLNDLADMAGVCGGIIFRDTVISAEQWLNFHGYDVSQSREQLSNLLTVLKFEFPAPTSTGNYWDILLSNTDNAFLQTTEQRAAIRGFTHEFFNGPTLLSVLMGIFRDISAASVRRDCDQTLRNLLTSDFAHDWAQNYLDALGWFGSGSQRPVAQETLEQVLLIAILLDLNPDPENSPRHVVSGYDLYQAANLNRTFAAVRDDLETHLIATGIASGNTAPLAAHLLLALAAPEFLVKDVPDTLLIGSVSWVNLKCDVALMENCMPGACRAMNQAQLTAFGMLDSVSEKQQQLRALLSVTPILDWAAINGLIARDPQGTYGKDAFEIAHAHFQQYTENLSQSIGALATPIPSRRELTLAAMQEVMPAGAYLEAQSLKYKAVFAVTELATVGLGFMRQSLVDFHMSGDLVVKGEFSKKLEVRSGYHLPPEVFPALKRLPDSKNQFERAFSSYYDNLQQGLLTILKLVISQLPDEDRAILENGHIDFFTVRLKADGVIDELSRWETRNQRDAAKGRYGLILCAEFEGQLHSYELFTLHGQCHKRPDLAQLLRSSGILHQHASLTFIGDKTAFQDKAEPLLWPVDANAYLQGHLPQSGKSSRVIVEKLFFLFPPKGEPRRLGSLQTYFSPRTTAIARFVLDNHPIATREELHASGWGATELETLRAKDAGLKTAIVNMVVPFKKCIEDLSSGDTQREAEGVGGCILDGLAVVGALIGAGGQIVSLAAKSTSVASRLVGVARVAAGTAVSLINPVDGLPSLAASGLKLTRKGLLLLSRHGVDTFNGALSQLHRITGSARSYDLVKAANRYDILQGSWKGTSGLEEPTDLFIVQSKGDWYSLNLKTGRAWGPRLPNLKLTDFKLVNSLHWIMPNSYARTYIGRGLPLAQNKIGNALQLLDQPQNVDVRSVLKLVFGNDSDDTLAYFARALSSMQKDLKSVSLSNLTFKSSTGGMAMAGLYPNVYSSWKTASKADATNTKFMVIHTEGMNDYYRATKYDDGRIADALIHEMSHGAPDTLDLYYADYYPKSSNPGDLDITQLLNLARHPGKVDPFHLLANADAFKAFRLAKQNRPPVVRDAPALLNADSFSLAVSLLNQVNRDRQRFEHNLRVMRTALVQSRNEIIKQPVIVRLSSPDHP